MVPKRKSILAVIKIDKIHTIACKKMVRKYPSAFCYHQSYPFLILLRTKSILSQSCRYSNKNNRNTALNSRRRIPLTLERLQPPRKNPLPTRPTLKRTPKLPKIQKTRKPLQKHKPLTLQLILHRTFQMLHLLQNVQISLSKHTITLQPPKIIDNIITFTLYPRISILDSSSTREQSVILVFLSIHRN